MVFNLGEIECKKLADEFLTGKMTVDCASKPKNDDKINSNSFVKFSDNIFRS